MFAAPAIVRGFFIIARGTALSSHTVFFAESLPQGLLEGRATLYFRSGVSLPSKPPLSSQHDLGTAQDPMFVANKMLSEVSDGIPAVNKYKSGAPNSSASADKHEFGAPNSFPSADKHESGATNASAPLDKHEFGAANASASLDKCEFGAANASASVNKHEFAATNLSASSGKCESGAANDLRRFYTGKFRRLSISSAVSGEKSYKKGAFWK